MNLDERLKIVEKDIKNIQSNLDHLLRKYEQRTDSFISGIGEAFINQLKEIDIKILRYVGNFATHGERILERIKLSETEIVDELNKKKEDIITKYYETNYYMENYFKFIHSNIIQMKKEIKSMPFISKEQMKKFFVLEKQGKLKKGTAKKWADKTPNIKKLPKRVKKANKVKK